MGLTPGETITATVTFPTVPAAGGEYFKVTGDGFVKYDNAVVNGAVAEIGLTDGGEGDLDKLKNGEILDPGAVGWNWIREGELKLARLSIKDSNLIRYITRCFAGASPQKGIRPDHDTIRAYMNAMTPDTQWSIDEDLLPAWLKVSPASGTGSAVIDIRVI